ncbi:DUF4340 domain-containing protein [Candidatus Peregrinibacteria bacterium]|nr:MAG: DUF4340 domain-containing protein [Candidatus Peregrinibacteria bacterium]
MNFFFNASGLKKLLMIFSFLAFLYFLETAVQQVRMNASDPSLFSNVPFDSVQSINISQSGASVRLVYQEGQWFVLADQSFVADQRRIRDFFSALTDATELKLVSENPQRQQVFKVDADAGIHVEMQTQQNDKVADFYIGSSGRGQQYYFRFADSDLVQLVQANVSDYLIGNAQSWRDHTIATVQEATLKRVALDDSNGQRVLEKQGDDWMILLLSPRKAEDLAMRTLLSRLELLKADGFASSREAVESDFEHPDYRLAFRFKDDSLKQFSLVAASDHSRYYLKSSETDLIYWVSNSFVDSIFKLDL